MEQIRKILCFFLVFAFLYGCASGTQAWHIREIHSDLDGSTLYETGPVYLKRYGSRSPTYIRVRLNRHTTMEPGRLILVAEYVAIEHLGSEDFGDEPSLHINIDGEIITLSSIDESTEIQINRGHYSHETGGGKGVWTPGHSISSKRYRIDKILLKKIIDGEKVLFKIDLKNSFVEERVIDDSRNAGAIFKKFYEKVFEENKNNP